MRFLVAIVALVMLAVAGPASAGSVPGELSRHCSLSGNPISEASSHPLIGIWDGDWDGKLKHTLIVYKVTGERVFVYYAYGIHRPWGINRGGCTRQAGTIVDNDIILDTFRNGAKVTYRPLDNNNLVGIYAKGGGFSYADLKRVY